MNERRTKWLVRGIGVLLGLILAGTALFQWRVPRGTGSVGADLTIAADPTGELGVTPTGPVLNLTDLRPGEEASAHAAEIQVRNQTGKTLYVRLRGLPSSGTLDQLVMLSIDRPDGSSLFRGTVGQLRDWTDRSMTLVPGEATTLSVRAWLPTGVTSEFEGTIEELDLAFQSTVGGT